MKKTLTVNLNNVVFHIDDDAYELLQNYLSAVEKQLSEDERKEVMSDIEARVAELFTERLQRNKNVVNKEDVEQIIEVLGKPSQFGGEESETETQSETGKQDKKRSRRFYRDPENTVLGGVCGGLSAYLGMDVTLLRIIFIILVFVGVGMIIPVYLIVWLIAPPAVTVAQRLEMQGEDVTIDSIKGEFNNVKNYVESDKFKNSAGNIGRTIGDVLGGIFKAIFGFLGAVLGFAGVILLGVLVLALMFLIFEPGILNGFTPEIVTSTDVLSSEKAVLFIISLLLVVGCPIFMIIHWVVRLVSGKKEFPKNTFWVTIVLWFAGLFMFYSVGAKTFIHWKQSDTNWIINFEDDNSAYTDEQRTVEPFREIEISGNIELEFTQDSVKSVKVSAPENSIGQVITKVENGVLKVYSEKVFMNRSIRLFVSNDSLYSMKASGASRVRTTNTLNAKSLDIEASGASNVKMDLNISSVVDVEANGASYCDLDGTANLIKVDASGASKVEADQLKAVNAETEANGASKIRVYSTGKLDADASGASTIKYGGSPVNINKSESGASEVKAD
jgi:phage shock protein PspC (stress-responsive transcriptional regulator)